MSSHREAPEISKDPVADSTDLYAFVSPDNPQTVTIIANYVPLESPDGGPNFYEFGDDVLYSINIDNNGDGKPDVIYEFRFTNKITNPDTFLYNTGPITSLTATSWNRRQSFTLTRVAKGRKQVLGSNLSCPPCNIGPLSTPNYATLALSLIHICSVGRLLLGGGHHRPERRAQLRRSGRILVVPPRDDRSGGLPVRPGVPLHGGAHHRLDRRGRDRRCPRDPDDRQPCVHGIPGPMDGGRRWGSGGGRWRDARHRAQAAAPWRRYSVRLSCDHAQDVALLDLVEEP